MRRVLMGIVWFVVIYFVACVAIGAFVGGIAGANNPENAAQAGAEASARIVGGNRIWIALGSVAISAIGSFQGWLPGTKE